MAIRMTITLPDDLLARLDRLVAPGSARSRNDLVIEAVRLDLRRREREAIDAAFYALADDPELRAEEDQIVKEFAGAGREAWAMIDADHGPYPAGIEAIALNLR